MNIKDKYFDLLETPGISPAQLLLLAYIDNTADEQGICRATNQELADFLHTQMRNAQRYLKLLRESGLIKIRDELNHKRLIVLNVDDKNCTDNYCNENICTDNNCTEEVKADLSEQIMTVQISNEEKKLRIKEAKKEIFNTPSPTRKMAVEKLRELGILTDAEIEEQIEKLNALCRLR